MNLRLLLIDLLGKTQISKWYDFLQKSQFWSLAELENYQNEKLRFLIKHAAIQVPYYRELFRDLKLTPDDFKTKDDLHKLPVLSRKDVQQNWQNLLAGNHKDFKSHQRNTGGTTGEPVKYFSDINSWSLHWALKYRAWEWGGYKTGSKVAVLGGASVIPEEKTTLKRMVWNKVNRLYPLPASHMDESLLVDFAGLIKKEKIHFVRGYPSSLAVFARFCLENEIKLDIKSVITTAEVLQEAYRDSILEAFNPVIIDTYGCADGGGNANTCKFNNGFHVSMESAIWEVCDHSGNSVPHDVEGEVTLTSLSNYAMPLIRYQPGDIIKNRFDYTACTCGCNLPRIEKIIGRSTEILSFNNGISLGGPAFTVLLRDFNLIKWQLVQNDMISVDVNIIPGPQFSRHNEEEIVRLMSHHCGTGVEVRLNKVKEIEVPFSGKQRVIINKTLK